MKLYSTPFETLNDDIVGIPSDTPIGIMAPAGEGKTILTTELALKFAIDVGGNILVIKTEKLNSMTHELWLARLLQNKKYGDKTVQMYVEKAKTVEELLKLNGYDMSVGAKKSKKEVTLSDVDIENSPVRKYIKEKNVKVVIYDSLTTPFNSVLTGGQQNMPTRTQVEEMFFQSLQLIFDNTDCAILTTNHITYNITSPFLSREQFDIKGGKAIKHMMDYIFYLEQGKSKHNLNQRTMYVVRHPILKDWAHSTILWLDDDGYKEMTKEEAARLRAKSVSDAKGETTPTTS